MLLTAGRVLIHLKSEYVTKVIARQRSEKQVNTKLKIPCTTDNVVTECRGLCVAFTVV